MANKSLTDLTARTATADSDLIHVNSGGTDYKETKGNFADDLAQRASFVNTSNIQTQAGSLSRNNKLYYGVCSAYGHQTETGAPLNANFYVTVQVNSSTSMRIELIVIGQSGRRFQSFMNSGTWTAWEELPARSEITSLNSSLTKSYDANVLPDITIGANGYTQVDKPSAVVGKSIVSLSILTWTSNTGAFWFATQGDSNNFFYVIGTPSAVIRGLKLRWWYKD